MVNVQQIINTIQQYSNNPKQLFKQFGIPEQLSTPQEVAQYLMNNGKVTQDQVNQANNLYKQLFNK